MTDRHRKSLSQLQREAQPMQIAGKPADVCPYCGASMFANRTDRGDSPSISFQYVVCRNCKKSFKAKIETKTAILYEVGASDQQPSSSGNHRLTLVRESA